jgi:hypothetical protein
VVYIGGGVGGLGFYKELFYLFNCTPLCFDYFHYRPSQERAKRWKEALMHVGPKSLEV